MPAPTEPRRRADSASAPSARSTADETVAAGASASGAIGFGPPTAPGEVGTLGPYRIVKELGKGGMGAVYAALDTRLDRKLALKVMLPESAADAHAKERFLREARAAARVKHDNVVTVYEADERDGVPYIAMEFLDGYPLDEYLKRKGTPTVAQVVQIAAEAASGLAAAHALGLVHRDIKPGNIWLEAPHGRVKVLDFGLARPMDAESELTKSGVVVGTPAYMSPEQARGQKVDHRADLFSLGALMYRLCAGRPPFQGPTTMAVLMALGTEEPPAVRDLNPTVPDALAALIHQLLAKPPEARPQSAAEVVNRLRAIAQELAAPRPADRPAPTGAPPQVVYVTTPVTAAGVSPFADLDSPDTEQMSDEFDEPPANAKPPKSSGRLVWAGLAALVAVVGVVVAVRSAGGSKPTAATPLPIDGGRGSGGGGELNPPSVDTDRAAAQWVIRQGGFVRVNGEQESIPTEALLPNRPFTLTVVGLAEMKVTDAGVSNLKGLKSLSYLVLWNTPVSDAALQHLTGLKAMSVLDLYGTQVTGAGLAHVKHCTGLTHLDLGGTQVGDAGLEHLKSLKNLTYLSLSGAPVTDAGLTHLKELKSLTRLDLGGTRVTAKGREELAAALPGCKLEALSPDREVACDALRFGGTVRVNGRNRELARAAELPKEAFSLTSVTLSDTRVADAGLEVLTDLNGLARLDLSDTAVSDAGLPHLRRLKGLADLNLRGTQVTTKGVAVLRAALPACRIVHDDDPLPPSEVDRATAKWAIKQGGSVRVDGERADRKTADQLPKAPFTLTFVNLKGTKVSDADLARLKDLKDLDWLDLADTPVTDAGLKHVKGLTSLTMLNVQATAVSDASVPALVELKNLKVLGLSDTKLTDAGLARLKEFPQLSLLELAGTKVTDAGLAHLAELKSLKLLDLDSTAVTNAGLKHLTKLGKLTGLDLRGTKVTDAGVAPLKTMKTLTELHLQKTGVTAKGLEELQTALPGCKINHDGTAEPKK